MIDAKVKIPKEKVIKVSRMKPVIKPTLAHRHAGYHELIFLSQGAGVHHIGPSVFEVLPPLGFYIRSGQVHAWDFSQVPAGFVILFKEEALASYLPTLCRLFTLPPTFDLPEDGDLLFLVKQFYHDYKAARNQDTLEAYLNLILLKSFESSPASAKVDSSQAADFYKYKLLVNTHFKHSRKVAYYANLMNMSVYKLNTVCLSMANAKAIDIIKERVLIEAKNLLVHTSHNISEIAYSLNFNDPSNFVKFFRSSTTITPSQYRTRSVTPN